MKQIKNILLLFVCALFATACGDEFSFSSAFDRYQVDNITAESGDGEVYLKWKAQDGKPTPDEYYITWTSSINGVEGGETTVAGNVTETTITGLENGVFYSFAVQARNSSGLSNKMIASCTPKSTRIAVTAFKAMAGDKRVFLSWAKPETSLSYIYNLDVFANGSKTNTFNPESNATSYLVENLTNGVEYTFVMTAVYSHGNSESLSATAIPGAVSPISVLPQSPRAFEKCQLEFNPAYFVEGEVTKVSWNFGEGETSDETAPYHCFSTIGKTTVTVSVVYASGKTDSGSLEIEVLPFAWGAASVDLWYQKSANVVFSNDGQTLYSYSQQSKQLIALDAISGVVKWIYATESASYGAGPVVGADDKIYVGTEDASGSFFALTPNGTLRWTAQLGAAVKAAPAVTSDGVVYVLTDDGTLHALNAEDGSVKWSKTDEGKAGGVAVDADGNIYIGTSSGMWSYKADGSKRWSCDKALNVTERGGSLALSNGLVYAALKGKNGVAAVDMNTGKTAWTYATTSGDCYHPIVDTEGTVYICEKSGGLYAVSKSGSLVWKYDTDVNFIYTGFALGNDGCAYISEYASPFNLLKITKSGNVSVESGIGAQTMSAITIGPDRRIYYCTNGSLGAYNLNVKLAESGWPMRGGNQQGSNSLR
ncbi:MAG: PQQ-binding-like beta-propeller repeat protein [Prevotella sp.]